jgi:hypothetical protein
MRLHDFAHLRLVTVFTREQHVRAHKIMPFSILTSELQKAACTRHHKGWARGLVLVQTTAADLTFTAMWTHQHSLWTLIANMPVLPSSADFHSTRLWTRHRALMVVVMKKVSALHRSPTCHTHHLHLVQDLANNPVRNHIGQWILTLRAFAE